MVQDEDIEENFVTLDDMRDYALLNYHGFENLYYLIKKYDAPIRVSINELPEVIMMPLSYYKELEKKFNKNE
jgi:hypothetical protein